MAERFIPIIELRQTEIRDIVEGNKLTPDAGQHALLLLKTLGDKTRLKMVDILFRSVEANVTTLSKALQMSQPSTSYHTTLMNTEGFLNCKPRGKNNYYSISRGGKKSLRNTSGRLRAIKGTGAETKSEQNKKVQTDEELLRKKTPLSTISTLAKMVGDEIRLVILHKLDQQAMNVGQFVEFLGMDQPGVSHHLALLLAENLVSVRQVHKHRIYSIQKENRVRLNILADYLDKISLHPHVRPLPRSSAKPRARKNTKTSPKSRGVRAAQGEGEGA